MEGSRNRERGIEPINALFFLAQAGGLGEKEPSIVSRLANNSFRQPLLTTAEDENVNILRLGSTFPARVGKILN